MKCDKLVAYFLVVTFFISHTVLAQSNNFNLPKVIPPSPAAQNFLRYGEIPVDYSTGVPNISIPFYTVKSRKLELPISISYHASGIKVADKASTIGLGWVINCNGLLAVTALGKLDGAVKPTYTTSAAFEAEKAAVRNDLDQFRQFGTTVDNELATTDYQSDRFSYQLPNGQSGVFRYSYLTGELIKLPYTPTKIEKITDNNAITGFKITDDQGNIYTFERPANWQAINPTVPNWNMTSIISADKTDTIRFVYKKSANQYITQNFVSALDIGPFPAGAGTNNGQGYENRYDFANYISSNSVTSETILDSIVASGTIIKFTTANDRQDKGISADSFRITNLSVSDRYSNSLIRSYSLYQSYFGSAGSNNLRLRLDSVSVKGADDIKVETYKFVYDPTELPPYVENNLASPYRFAEDYWGYYNGIGSNSLIPYQMVPTISSGNLGPPATVPPYSVGDRSPNHGYARACMLQEIQYPTGGKTVFEFEPNYATGFLYDNMQSIQPGNVGGFRIKKVSNYTDPNHLAWYKTYEYSTGKTRLMHKALYGYLRRVSGIYVDFYNVSRLLITSNPLQSLTYQGGPPVFYETVTEYTGDSYNGSLGKTEYNYLEPDAEEHNECSNGLFFDGGPVFMDNFELDKGNYIPKMYSKTEFKIENGQYIPVHKTENIWSRYFAQQRYYTGMHVTLATYYPGGSSDFLWDYHWCIDLPDLGHFCNNQQYYHPDYYCYYDMHATPQADVLTKTVDTYYGNNNSQPLVTTTLYTYDEMYLHLIEKEVNNSKNESIKTVYKYPNDFSGTAVYDAMVQKNIVTPVIEQSVYKNNTTFLQSAITNYNFWDGSAWSSTPANIIAPQSVEAKTLTQTSYDPRIRYQSYDNLGNITAVSKESDIAKVYIWGYSNSYPVAEITGASYNNVMAVLDQNILQYPSSDQALRDELQKIRQNFPAALVTTYTYKPLVGITSTTDAGNHTTYYEYDNFGRLIVVRDQDGNILKKICYSLTGQETDCFTGTYYNTYKSASFDRTNCGNGFWGGTVTYSVMPGIYSSTVSQAEADQQALNDINANGQSYANANGECLPLYYNVEISRVFTRNNCGAGYAGGQVTYTVPAGTYVSKWSQAEANDRASMDINANGQDYANAHGTCTPAYFNTEKRATFTKNDCTEPYVGSIVTYVVPAGKYSSFISPEDAEQKAVNDLNANGQAYANTYGSCVSPGITLHYNSTVTNTAFYITATDVNTGNDYFFYIDTDGSGDLGIIPPGVYNVQIYDNCFCNSHVFYAGCSGYATGTSANMPNVTLSASCNTISIN